MTYGQGEVLFYFVHSGDSYSTPDVVSLCQANPQEKANGLTSKGRINMNKKNRCATALVATALLSYGFTLDTTEEIAQSEPEPTIEVTVTHERKPVIKPEDVVEVKHSDSKTETEQPLTDTTRQPAPEDVEEESPPPLPPEPTYKPTFEPPEATNQTPQPAEPSQTIPNVTPPKAEEKPPQIVTPPDIPNQPPTSQTDDVLHEILSDTYDFKVDEVIYTENSIIHITYPPENQVPVYVDGFGWVEPSNEPSIRIEALDMVENGNKVGTMGGG